MEKPNDDKFPDDEFWYDDITKGKVFNNEVKSEVKEEDPTVKKEPGLGGALLTIVISFLMAFTIPWFIVIVLLLAIKG